MSKRLKIVLHVFIAAALAAAVSLGAFSQAAPPLVRVLVVDETKTFASTMRVASLVGALRSAALFDTAVALADATSSFDAPLAGRQPEPGAELYDLIVILPRGLDDGSVRQIWIVSAGLSQLPPAVAASLGILSGTIDQVFAGIGEATDVSEDLWPCLLWAVYLTKGWI